MLRTVVLTALAVVLAVPALAIDIDDDFYFDAETPTPAAILAIQDCGADERTNAHRKAFAGGFIFLVQCASNNENYVETLIFADNEAGEGGSVLLFPGPGERREGFEELLSNIRWFPGQREIGHIFVDREDPEVCRVEGRWRLEGNPPKPRLIYWRETKDCDGNTGWVTLRGN